ncbi:MAG: hypothetical protein A2114_02855 [Candidatus Vogelbacteria bacterium GWA1_51_14]|uniref:Uncharacterized protein n=1 Tax=Candidatus Vogelbacteria bacterium GWA1_51_14 TaxID=1802435 RepID=A0A1G2Q9B0_9BACT|nr:MAG: hypothetical protein A2114_02855 [Candidatus Vogelbacteria bacterium GWA1_51_14]
MPQAKRRYVVYKCFASDETQFLASTAAVSEADAVNNVRFNHWGKTSAEILEKEYHFHLQAAVANSAKDLRLFSRSDKAKRFRQVRAYRPKQLELPGVGGPRNAQLL